MGFGCLWLVISKETSLQLEREYKRYLWSTFVGEEGGHYIEWTLCWEDPVA